MTGILQSLKKKLTIKKNTQGGLTTLSKIYTSYSVRNYNPQILLLMMVIIFSTIQTAFCGTLESHRPIMDQAEEILRVLNSEELNEFNRLMNIAHEEIRRERQQQLDTANNIPGNSIIRNIAIALAINATIVFLVAYGPSIWDVVRDTTVNIVNTITENLLQQARDAAIHRVRTLDPERATVALNILREIVENRPGGAA